MHHDRKAAAEAKVLDIEPYQFVLVVRTASLYLVVDLAQVTVVATRLAPQCPAAMGGMVMLCMFQAEKAALPEAVFKLA